MPTISETPVYDDLLLESMDFAPACDCMPANASVLTAIRMGLSHAPNPCPTPAVWAVYPGCGCVRFFCDGHLQLHRNELKGRGPKSFVDVWTCAACGTTRVGGNTERVEPLRSN